MKKNATLTLIGAALAAWLLLNQSVFASLHQRWIRLDEPYAVGYPTLLLALWWLYNRRATIAATATGPAPIALLALAGTLMLSVAGGLVHFQLLQQVLMPASLWLLLAALLGWRSAWPAAPAFLVFYLAIPAFDISVPLRTMTVWFTQHFLQWMAVPALIDGFLITLPAGIIEVAGSCSGFNFLLASLFMGLMYGEAAHQPFRRRTGIVALAVAIGIIDNWIRVLALVLIAYYSEMQNPLIYHHGSFGWWIFAGSLVPFFILARYIERPVSINNPSINYSSLQLASPSVARMAAAIIVLCLGLWWGATGLAQTSGKAVAGFVPAGVIPMGAGWMPRYEGQDVTQFWRGMDGGRLYELTALTYISERTDKKLIYYANRIADERQLHDTGKLSVADDFAVRTAVINDGGWRMVWWFWRIDGETSTNSLATKTLQLKAQLMGDRSSAFMAVSVRCASRECADEKAPTPYALQLLFALRDARKAE